MFSVIPVRFFRGLCGRLDADSQWHSWLASVKETRGLSALRVSFVR